ncbi:mCG146326, partial [Mus musculus]
IHLGSELMVWPHGKPESRFRMLCLCVAGCLHDILSPQKSSPSNIFLEKKLFIFFYVYKFSLGN